MVTFRISFFQFLIEIHSIQGWTATMRHAVTRKKKPKKIRAHRDCLERTSSSKMSFNSRLKTTKITGQRKAFYRQRIPESSCARKETIDIDILITSRNGDRKIMRSIRIMSIPPSRKSKWNQFSHFWKTSTKVIPIEKTLAGNILMMNQGFKRSRKWRTNSPAYFFLQPV